MDLIGLKGALSILARLHANFDGDCSMMCLVSKEDEIGSIILDLVFQMGFAGPTSHSLLCFLF